MINYARPFALAMTSLLLSGAALSALSANEGATETQLQRGKYLVEFSTCTDCHRNITILLYSRAREAGPSRAALRIPTAGAADFFLT